MQQRAAHPAQGAIDGLGDLGGIAAGRDLGLAGDDRAHVSTHGGDGRCRRATAFDVQVCRDRPFDDVLRGQKRVDVLGRGAAADLVEGEHVGLIELGHAVPELAARGQVEDRQDPRGIPALGLDEGIGERRAAGATAGDDEVGPGEGIEEAGLGDRRDGVSAGEGVGAAGPGVDRDVGAAAPGELGDDDASVAARAQNERL